MKSLTLFLAGAVCMFFPMLAILNMAEFERDRLDELAPQKRIFNACKDEQGFRTLYSLEQHGDMVHVFCSYHQKVSKK